MRKVLLKLYIIQKVSNTNRKPRLGKGYSEAFRLNPWNPLSYLTILIVVPIGLLLFGLIGFWEEVPLNPFKWN